MKDSRWTIVITIIVIGSIVTLTRAQSVNSQEISDHGEGNEAAPRWAQGSKSNKKQVSTVSYEMESKELCQKLSVNWDGGSQDTRLLIAFQFVATPSITYYISPYLLLFLNASYSSISQPSVSMENWSWTLVAGNDQVLASISGQDAHSDIGLTMTLGVAEDPSVLFNFQPTISNLS